MLLKTADLSPNNCYHLLTQTVIPRPIAWVLSQNDVQQGGYNLAPFSFFNALCSNPPLVALSVGKKPSGELKDTRVNLLSGRDFVVHIAAADQAGALNTSAASLAYGESEIEAAGLSLAEFPGCAAPRIQGAAAAYHCRFYEVHELGVNKQAVIYAEILQVYLDDDKVEQRDGRYIVDAHKLNPLARLGGSDYATLGERFSIARPK